MSNWKDINMSWEDLRKLEAKKAEQLEEEERRKTASVNLKAFNEKQSDWYGKCRNCGKERRGTMAEVTAPCGCNG